MSTVLWLRLSPSLPRQKMDNYNPSDYDLGSIYVDPSDHLSIQTSSLSLPLSLQLCLSLSLSAFVSPAVCLRLSVYPSASVSVSV